MVERTRLRMHSERSVPGEVDAILTAGRVAHVGFEVDGQPYVIPMLYHYDPPAGGGADDTRLATGRLYLHGGTKSRAMRHLAAGAPICVTVTHLDQLVYSKTALDHSANYRSAVCFGTCRRIDDREEKNEVLERMVARYFEGRTGGVDYQHATSQHLKATALVEVEIEAVSGKMRVGDPSGPDDLDPDAPGTAGLAEV